MPILNNARHERFAQGLAKGLSADQAYQEAGYKASRSAASRLSANVNIQARVSEIIGRAAERAEWTAADRLVMLKRISENCEKKDPRVSVSAIGEANKMQGSHAAERHELLGPDGGPIQHETRTWREVLRSEG